MVQVYAIFFLFYLYIITAIGSTPINATSNIFASIEVIDNNSTFQKIYPEVEIVSFDVSKKAVGSLTHTLGERTPWDSIIGYATNFYVFPSPRNIRLSLMYPARIIDRRNVITYVEIKVLQTSNLGRARVTAGGIGKKYIHIVVEAFKTSRFEYKASFYNSASQLEPFGLIIPLVSLLFFSNSILNF